MVVIIYLETVLEDQPLATPHYSPGLVCEEYSKNSAEITS